MNEPMPIAVSELETPLTAEEQAFLQAFLRLPTQEMVHCLNVVQRWARATGARKAIALTLLDAELTAKDVARLCGLSDRQLRRYPEYRAFVQLLRQGKAPPRGVKSSRDGVESWEEEE